MARAIESSEDEEDEEDEEDLISETDSTSHLRQLVAGELGPGSILPIGAEGGQTGNTAGKEAKNISIWK
jgi:hypothetical protein